LLLEPLLLFEVSLFGVEPMEPVLGLLLELEPMLPELPELPLVLLPLVPEDDVPPAELDEPCPAFHSSRLIWPSWFLSSLSNSAEPPLLEDELPPAALGDEDDEDDGVEVELELPPAAELDLPADDEPLLDIEGCDDWLLFCFAESSA
jgi:hypothetical protein